MGHNEPRKSCPPTPDEVVDRVLRRVEVSKASTPEMHSALGRFPFEPSSFIGEKHTHLFKPKKLIFGREQMARNLKDRLALASYKASNGMEHLNIELLESMAKKKQPSSSVVSSSDSSTSSRSTPVHYPKRLASSPLSAPIFSDEVYGQDTNPGSRKRARFSAHASFIETSPTRNRKNKLRRAHTLAAPAAFEARPTWKGMHDLADSSPLRPSLHPDFRTSHGPNISFASETSTIADSPLFISSKRRGSAVAKSRHDVDMEDDLPSHSFSHAHPMHGSPPRTPPPTRSRAQRGRKSAANTQTHQGADLLLYLAGSPSPGNPQTLHNSHAPSTPTPASHTNGVHTGLKPPNSASYPPSTPPSTHATLPSQMLATPGGTNLFSAFNTPGPGFNFSDFVNVTPSPAQGPWLGERTPGIGSRTPAAAKEARRRLEFGGETPVLEEVEKDSEKAARGLGMELGGELKRKEK